MILQIYVCQGVEFVYGVFQIFVGFDFHCFFDGGFPEIIVELRGVGGDAGSLGL
ncbi:MAG: hypothetical protein ACD_51C00265G0001 [uncultured bacterium]|nr:MAG: hypothetical protein ACD_51C00265G0001 [uncultured bacterium]